MTLPSHGRPALPFGCRGNTPSADLGAVRQQLALPGMGRPRFGKPWAMHGAKR